jgi:hypothetical protein
MSTGIYPDYGTQQGGKHHIFINYVGFNNTLADGFGYMDTKNKDSREIPEGGPGNGEVWGEYLGGNHRGNGVGGIVHPIKKIECKRNDDDGNYQ